MNWRCRTARHALSTEVSIFIDENIIFIDENTSNVHEEVDRYSHKKVIKQYTRLNDVIGKNGTHGYIMVG